MFKQKLFSYYGTGIPSDIASSGNVIVNTVYEGLTFDYGRKSIWTHGQEFGYAVNLTGELSDLSTYVYSAYTYTLSSIDEISEVSAAALIAINNKIGDIESLDTEENGNLVSAVNYTYNEVSNLSTYVYSAYTYTLNAVDEISEVNAAALISLNSKLGDIESLDTPENSNLVSSINYTYNAVDDLSTYVYSAYTYTLNAIDEISEVNAAALISLNTKIGDIESLETTTNTDLVSSINSINSYINGMKLVVENGTHTGTDEHTIYFVI